jgi:hypothetical protein
MTPSFRSLFHIYIIKVSHDHNESSLKHTVELHVIERNNELIGHEMMSYRQRSDVVHLDRQSFLSCKNRRSNNTVAKSGRFVNSFCLLRGCARHIVTVIDNDDV